MEIKPQNELAMIVALYLSKFGDESLTKIGFETYKQAFKEIGRSLNVNANSVKNWRDEFDPFYDNRRKGWYQRGMRPTQQKVVTLFDDLSEDALRKIVLDIISPRQRLMIGSDLGSALKEIKAIDDSKPGKRVVEYVPRGPTGRMAEEYFLSQFYAGLTPFSGVIKDRRDDGVGFDFEISDNSNSSLVEVKGMSKDLNGIVFTDKEWKIANKTQSNYYLGLVVHVSSLPKIGFMQNPAKNFTATYRAYTIISVNWGINTQQLSKIKLN
jgi:hypothetical protein